MKILLLNTVNSQVNKPRCVLTNANTPYSSQGVGVILLLVPPDSSAFVNTVRRVSNKWLKGNLADWSAIDGSKKQMICSVISGQRMSEMSAENTACLKKRKIEIN